MTIIEWEVEEGHTEFSKDDGKHTVSIHPGGNRVDIYGTFSLDEMVEILMKMDGLVTIKSEVEK